MSTPHKATPDQWEKVKYLARLPNSHWAIVSCLLELRARVEVLESDGPAVSRDREPASVAMQPTPASSLVERVAIALAESDHPHQLWHDEARAAIHEVAAWFTTITPRGSEAWRMASEILRQEASR